MYTHMQRLYYTVDNRTPYTLEQKYLISNKIYLQRIHISLGFVYTVTLSVTKNESNPVLWHTLTITRHINNNKYHIFKHTVLTASTQHSHSCTNSPEYLVPKHMTTSGNLLQEGVHYSDSCTLSIKNERLVSMERKSTSERQLQGVLYHTSPSQRETHDNNKCVEQETEWSLTKQFYHHLTQSSREEPLPGDHFVSIRVATFNMWNLNSIETEQYTDRLERIGKVQ